MMMRKPSLIILALLTILPMSVQAVPQFLNHQGQILLPDGSPASGVTDVTFKLYTVPTNGSHIWSQTLSIAFDNGYYSVTLGPGNPTLSTSIIDGSDLYLGITLEGTNEFEPRQRIASVPYALMSGSCVGEVNATEGLFVNGEEVIDTNGAFSIPRSDFGDLPAADSENQGQLYYSTDPNTVYFSNGTEWIDLTVGGGCEVPTLGSLTPSQINPGEDVTITINGSGFKDGCVVEIGDMEAPSINFVNAGEVTITTGTSLESGIYELKLTNPEGLRGFFTDGLVVDAAPEWATTEGSLGTVIDTVTGDHFTLEATDAEGQPLTFALVQGNLPTGLSLDPDTGIISGDPEDVENDTQYDFTISVEDNASTPNVVEQDFSITISHCIGVSESSPAGSCQEIAALGCSGEDGLFWIKPESSPAVQLFCDMTSDGGGWTLVAVNGDNRSYTMTTGAQGNQALIRRSNPGGNVIHKLSDAAINEIKTSNGSAIGIRLIWEVAPNVRKYGRSSCVWQSNSTNPSSTECDYMTGTWSTSPSWSGPHSNYWFSGGLPSTSAGGCPSWQRMGIYSGEYSSGYSTYHCGSCGLYSWGTLWVK